MIADRAKLMEEIDILKKLKISNGVNGLSKEGDLLSEIIKVKWLYQFMLECLTLFILDFLSVCKSEPPTRRLIHHLFTYFKETC